MVLAAGLGSRLAPLTDHCPKPLLEMGGRSLLARALDELCKTTVTQVVINIHHLGSQIETYLETQAPWPFPSPSAESRYYSRPLGELSMRYRR